MRDSRLEWLIADSLKDEFELMANHVNALFKCKAIRPVIGHKYKLEEAAKAQNDVINNTGTTGRLTLLVA